MNETEYMKAIEREMTAGLLNAGAPVAYLAELLQAVSGRRRPSPERAAKIIVDAWIAGYERGQE